MAMSNQASNHLGNVIEIRTDPFLLGTQGRNELHWVKQDAKETFLELRDMGPLCTVSPRPVCEFLVGTMA